MLDFNNQVWASLSGPYEISNLGLIKNKRTNRPLKPHKIGTDYYVSLYRHANRGQRKTIRVKELLTQEFPDSPVKIDSDWFEQIRLRYFKKERPKAKPKFSRTCVDCGIGTNNYRCSACWAKKRGIGAHEEGVGYFSGRVICGRKSW